MPDLRNQPRTTTTAKGNRIEYFYTECEQNITAFVRPGEEKAFYLDADSNFKLTSIGHDVLRICNYDGVAEHFEIRFKSRHHVLARVGPVAAFVAGSMGGGISLGAVENAHALCQEYPQYGVCIRSMDRARVVTARIGTCLGRAVRYDDWQAFAADIILKFLVDMDGVPVHRDKLARLGSQHLKLEQVRGILGGLLADGLITSTATSPLSFEGEDIGLEQVEFVCLWNQATRELR